MLNGWFPPPPPLPLPCLLVFLSFLAPQSYSYPVALVSPPIILQTRLESTDTCKNELGTVYLGKIWNDTVSGVACESPYECDEDLRKDQLSHQDLVTKRAQ